MTTRTLDDPAWFGAVMGTAAVAGVAASNPARFPALAGFGEALSIILLTISVVAFFLLLGRGILRHRITRSRVADIKSPLSGPAFATIPGGINVVALALLRVVPGITDSTAGWWLIAGLTLVGTGAGLALTVVFFVAAFEERDFDARDISGIWFIPETVVLLGAVLAAELAVTGPESAARTLAILSLALLGAGGILFGITAALLVNRLVLHAQVERVGAAAMWIMMSPLSVAALVVHRVAGSASILSGHWEPAVQIGADLLAATLWGFALWWIATAAIVTMHAGRSALHFQPSSWGYVFPPAAMTLATLTLGRAMDSAFMEVLAVFFALALLGITVATLIGSIRLITADHRSAREEATTLSRE